MKLRRSLSIISLIVISMLFAIFSVNASQQQVLVEITEYVDQNVIYNPLKTGAGIWYDTTENQSSYDLIGYIYITNTNPTGEDISDIYLNFTGTGNITLPTLYEGRNGTFISSNVSSGSIVLHVPELKNGENSSWTYLINKTSIKPPLNFTSNYSDAKLLAGENITITDTIHNVFDNATPETCIYDINITQVTVPVDFNGFPQDWLFVNTSTTGTDATNVTYSADEETQYWDALAGGCLNKDELRYISYDVETPLNIPTTTHFTMINSTLQYKLNNTFSQMILSDITAISQASPSFEKKIENPSHPILYGSNVTWNVTAYFRTDANITYNLSTVTLWVSQRNVNGSYTDPNTVDNDSISNASLTTTLNPGSLVNLTTTWSSSNWLFNYSDIPSPIVWMDVNFTIYNDGTQLVNRSIIQNGNDVYIKELYLILGYWLEIEKNITSLSATNDTFNVRIDVHNKGNQVTPAGTVVTIYDFVPSNFNVSSSFVYSSSPWYNTTIANTSVAGGYNGTLYQWGLIPNTVLNTSFAAGPAYNVNTTWYTEFNVTGIGDYTLLDVFVTGLDPQQVDGAGATKSVIVEEVLDRIKSTEGIFAAIASILLLLGLLL